MTAGFSSWRFNESVVFEEDLSNNSLERYLLNSLIFISSKNGTWIFIFWTSFSKLKEDGDFRIYLTSGVGSSIKNGGF